MLAVMAVLNVMRQNATARAGASTRRMSGAATPIPRTAIPRAPTTSARPGGECGAVENELGEHEPAGHEAPELEEPGHEAPELEAADGDGADGPMGDRMLP